MEKIGEGRYVVGVNQGITEEYGRTLEFGTDDIEERSYLRDGLERNHKELVLVLKQNFSKLF